MPEPLGPAVGWGALHLFCKVVPGRPVDAQAVATAVKASREDGHQVVCFAVLGHKADVGFFAIGPDLWRLRRFQGELSAAGLDIVDSYVSMTEVNEYAKGLPPELLEARLHPNIPPNDMRAICFYPMSKRRGETSNWFTLPYDERKELMYGHGKSGRAFAGRVVQLITGSTGIDDHEWGVTLFAHDPADLKEVVYTMRFDEASALYAEFGEFITGLVAEPEDLEPYYSR